MACCGHPRSRRVPPVGLPTARRHGAGIGLAVMAQNYVYESKTLRFFAINAAYVVVGLGIMGTIIGTIQG